MNARKPDAEIDFAAFIYIPLSVARKECLPPSRRNPNPNTHTYTHKINNLKRVEEFSYRGVE